MPPPTPHHRARQHGTEHSSTRQGKCGNVRCCPAHFIDGSALINIINPRKMVSYPSYGLIFWNSSSHSRHEPSQASHSIPSLPSPSPLLGPGGVPFVSFRAILHCPCAYASGHTHARAGCHWLLQGIAMQSSVAGRLPHDASERRPRLPTRSPPSWVPHIWTSGIAQ